MEPIKDAFAASIARAEKTLRDKRRGSVETPRERGHAVTKLSEERARRRAAEASQIVAQVRRLGLDADTLAKIDAAAAAHSQSSEKWMFVMLSPAQNADVVRWINKNSLRPRKATELWATVLEHLRMDTGEIMATRQELADRTRMEPGTVSFIMGELASINAIRKERQGRKIVYFLNPNIATHLPNATKRAQARAEAGGLLTLMEGGKSDRS